MNQGHKTETAQAAAKPESPYFPLAPGKALLFVGGLSWLVAGLLPGDIPYNTVMSVMCWINSASCSGLAEEGYQFRGRIGCLGLAAIFLLFSTPSVIRAFKARRGRNGSGV